MYIKCVPALICPLKEQNVTSFSAMSQFYFTTFGRLKSLGRLSEYCETENET